MTTLEGLDKLQKKLRDLKKKAGEESNPSVVVGYTQSYALPVHENLEARHRDGKQAKYLETPARELADELGTIAKTVYTKTGSLEKGLLAAGLRLQRASQEIVPIDTSALRASAFTALERDVESKSEEAFSRSEGIKAAELVASQKMAKKKGISLHRAMERRRAARERRRRKS